MPLLVYGSKFIERTSANQWLLLPLVVVTFFIPFMVSTADLKFLAKTWRESGVYPISVRRDDFRLFFIPAWLRMFVWFISAVASVLLLKAAGVEL